MGARNLHKLLKLDEEQKSGWPVHSRNAHCTAAHYIQNVLFVEDREIALHFHLRLP